MLILLGQSYLKKKEKKEKDGAVCFCCFVQGQLQAFHDDFSVAGFDFDPAGAFTG